MDKIKPYLEILKKYHFWILAVVVTIAAVVVRSQAGSGLTQATQTQQSKLSSSFSTTQTLSSDEAPKTAKHTEVWTKAHGALKENAEEGFEILREPLTQQSPFKWPKLKNNKLPGFMETAGPKDQIPEKIREEYENYMKNELRQVLAAGNVIRQERTDGGPLEGEDEDAAAKAPTEERGVVEWAAADREEFEKRFTFNETPTTEQIKILQEDYWLYEAILKTIAGVNKSCKGPYDAVVSKIHTLAITQRAVDRQIQAMPSLTSPAKEGGVAGTNLGIPPKKTSPAIPALGAPAAELEKSRYVDELGNPLATKAASKTPEFTFVPVYLELVVHQQKIAELVTQLRNSILPVHVTRIAISDALTPTSSGAGAAPAASQGGQKSAPSMGMKMSSPSTTNRPQAAKAQSASRYDAKKQLKRPNDVLVQLSGVLIMVNPPAPKPGAPGGQPVAAAPGAPAAPPAAAPGA